MTAELLTDKVAEGNRLFAAGNLEAAAKLFLDALNDDGTDLEAAYGLGTVALRIGEFPRALEIAGLLTSAQPHSTKYLHLQGEAAIQLRRADEAVDVFRRLLALDPDNEDARKRLINALLPGETYYHLLARLHPLLTPSTYIEIGIDRGRSLFLAGPDCRAIGIDPAPVIDVEFQGTPDIHTVTSDAFFAEQDVPALLGQPHFDLAFIDGLHTFDQALKDFINLTRYAGPDSVILMHDCYPLDAASCTRDRQTNIWSGDVWKVVCALRHAVPDIDLVTIKTPPTGLGLAKNCHGLYETLDARYDDLVAMFKDRDFEWLADDMDRRLNAIPNDWQSIVRHLGRG